MSSWATGDRPITIAILAMGGEGGGVLADWIVNLGERAGYVSQNTSVAGVAQRTGATVYYVELYPPKPGREGDVLREPVLSLFPTPGEVDVVIASELMEAGRAIQRGFATPDRTTLIASTNRVYAMDEKRALADGRVDSNALLEACQISARRFIGADFMQLAVEARSVISASLFGALAGSGALDFPESILRTQFARAARGWQLRSRPSSLGLPQRAFRHRLRHRRRSRRARLPSTSGGGRSTLPRKRRPKLSAGASRSVIRPNLSDPNSVGTRNGLG